MTIILLCCSLLEIRIQFPSFLHTKFFIFTKKNLDGPLLNAMHVTWPWGLAGLYCFLPPFRLFSAVNGSRVPAAPESRNSNIEASKYR
jgi:hypothetical protein